MTKLYVASFLFFAACGGGGSSQPAAPTPPVEPAQPTEPATAAEPAPTTPAEPAAPAEPPAPAQPDPAQVKADLLAVETAAFEKAKPAFDKWCARCHAKGGKNANAKKLAELDITSYPFTGKHAAAEEIREVLGLTGKKPTMPADKKGAVKGEDLEVIKAWADAFDASHKGGAHEGHDAGHKH